MEIERKFRLTNLPTQLRTSGEEILQGYLPVQAGEVRVRRKGGSSFLTVKGDGTLCREEWDSHVPQWVFGQLWPETAGRRIEKTRYRVAYQDLILEIDEYHGRLAGLITMECEFPTIAAAEAFALPEWAEGAVDVTGDAAYKNKSLASAG